MFLFFLQDDFILNTYNVGIFFLYNYYVSYLTIKC